MPEPLRQIRTPEEIFKARIEKKLVKKAIPEATRQRIIDLLRIRKGLLSEKELENIKAKLLYSEKELLVHFTDIEFLYSIFENGLRLNSESSGYTFPDLYVPESTGNYSGAPRSYNSVINDFGKTSSDKKSNLISFFNNSYGPLKLETILYVLNNLSSSKQLRQIVTLKEIQEFNNYVKRYRLGNNSFFEDSNQVNKIIEFIARLYARISYSSGNFFKFASSFNVCLLYDPLTTSHNEYGDIISKSKPIGLYVPNEVNLQEVLHIMFANAKSLDDIVLIYGNKGKLLWPM